MPDVFSPGGAEENADMFETVMKGFIQRFADTYISLDVMPDELKARLFGSRLQGAAGESYQKLEAICLRDNMPMVYVELCKEFQKRH